MKIEITIPDELAEAVENGLLQQLSAMLKNNLLSKKDFKSKKGKDRFEEIFQQIVDDAFRAGDPKRKAMALKQKAEREAIDKEQNEKLQALKNK